MQEKTPLEKDYSPYNQYVEEARVAAAETSAFLGPDRCLKARIAYERAISSLEKIPENERDDNIWLKLVLYKADLAYTYFNHDSSQVRLTQTMLNEVVEFMESQTPLIKPDNLCKWLYHLGHCYSNLSVFSCNLPKGQWITVEENDKKAIWSNAEENAKKAIACFEKIHNEAFLRPIAKCQMRLGIAYQHQNQFLLARGAFFSAIGNQCNVALATTDDSFNIMEYFKLIPSTYCSGSLSKEVLKKVISNVDGMTETADDFFELLSKIMAQPSADIDENIFSYALLPITKFIRSNQNNPNLLNITLPKLSPEHLKQLDALIENLENRKNTVQSLANQSLTRVIIDQEQRIRALEQKIATLERKLEEPQQIVAPPQPKPEEKTQSTTITQFFRPLQNIPLLEETSSRKRKLEEPSEGPPAKKMNTK